MLVAVARHDHVYHHSKRSTFSYNPLPLKVGLKPNIPSSSTRVKLAHGYRLVPRVVKFGFGLLQNVVVGDSNAKTFITRAPDRLSTRNQEGEQFQPSDASGAHSRKCFSGDRPGQHHTD